MVPHRSDAIDAGDVDDVALCPDPDVVKLSFFVIDAPDREY
jgi:hypothetical protein